MRMRIEKGFGWLKTVGGPRKTKLIGRGKLSAKLLLGFSVYSLIRLGQLGLSFLNGLLISYQKHYLRIP